MSDPPETFICVDCGGTAHLISFLPEDAPLEPGTPLAYRCSDCLERFDVVWEDFGEN
ncbi:MAG TPA: hypothetical protein VFV13_12880 [Acidimicrobiia bacterium]|nr:hypothetical protein [Acidimicrobiia bacterium]